MVRILILVCFMMMPIFAMEEGPSELTPLITTSVRLKDSSINFKRVLGTSSRTSLFTICKPQVEGIKLIDSVNGDTAQILGIESGISTVASCFCILGGVATIATTSSLSIIAAGLSCVGGGICCCIVGGIAPCAYLMYPEYRNAKYRKDLKKALEKNCWYPWYDCSDTSIDYASLSDEEKKNLYELENFVTQKNLISSIKERMLLVEQQQNEESRFSRLSVDIIDKIGQYLAHQPVSQKELAHFVCAVRKRAHECGYHEQFSINSTKGTESACFLLRKKYEPDISIGPVLTKSFLDVYMRKEDGTHEILLPDKTKALMDIDD